MSNCNVYLPLVAERGQSLPSVTSLSVYQLPSEEGPPPTTIEEVLARLDALEKRVLFEVGVEGAAVEDRVREEMERQGEMLRDLVGAAGEQREMLRDLVGAAGEQGEMLQDLVGAVGELRRLVSAIVVAVMRRLSLRVRRAIWDLVGRVAGCPG